MEGLDLGVAELVGEDRQPDRPALDRQAEPVEGGGQDQGVIECEVERTVRIEPGGVRGVVAPRDFGDRAGDGRRVGDADRPPARVTAGLAEDSDGGERAAEVQPGLLAQLAPGGALDRLVDVQEAARDRPPTDEGIVLAPDEEGAEAPR